MKYVLLSFLSAVLLSVIVATGSGFVLSRNIPAHAEQADVSLTHEENYLDADVPSVENPAISTGEIVPTSTVHLVAPPVAHLRAVVGDPKILEGDIPIRVPVLMYHHIRPLTANLNPKERYFSVTPEVFEAQMIGLVKAGYHSITPQELSRALTEGPSNLPSKPVLITLDDGFKDQYKYAFPVMKRLGIHSTFFVVSQSFHQGGALKLSMIKELDETGLVTIAAHTRHHANLPKLSPEKMWEEIHGSKEDLETLLGHPVTVFAYPYGGISAKVMEEVKRAGFDLGFWVQAGSLHVASSRYQLHRIRVLDREDVVPLLDGFSTSTHKQ